LGNRQRKLHPEKSEMKDIIHNADFRPKRKILGFYFDSLGKIQTLEEGLSETEKLALLQFMQCYGRAEAEEIYSRSQRSKPGKLA
jgi:hypothetical protein